MGSNCTNSTSDTKNEPIEYDIKTKKQKILLLGASESGKSTFLKLFEMTFPCKKDMEKVVNSIKRDIWCTVLEGIKSIQSNNSISMNINNFDKLKKIDPFNSFEVKTLGKKIIYL